MLWIDAVYDIGIQNCLHGKSNCERDICTAAVVQPSAMHSLFYQGWQMCKQQYNPEFLLTVTCVYFAPTHQLLKQIHLRLRYQPNTLYPFTLRARPSRTFGQMSIPQACHSLAFIIAPIWTHLTAALATQLPHLPLAVRLSRGIYCISGWRYIAGCWALEHLIYVLHGA
jgi:hypothetical protein